MKPLLTFLTLGLIAAAQDRMPPIPADKMTPEQKQAVADYKKIRGADLTGPPWTAILRLPDLTAPSLEIRLHNQRNSGLKSAKLTELAILIAARQWTNNFEWNAHSTLAKNAGLSDPILAALADG